VSGAALDGSTGPLWWDSPPQAGTAAHPASDLPQTADVVVVGGGFTGLWTAYYLLRDNPGREVLVLEARHVGFGASGRNGGWVSALWPVGADTLDRQYGRTATLAQLAALRDTVDEVGRVDAEEGLGSGFVKGGALVVARTAAQEVRARVSAAHAAAWGDGTIWPPESASTSPAPVAPPSTRTAPGCSPAGSSTGWRRRCAGSVAASSRAPAWLGSATGSWCSPTTAGSPPAPSSSPPRAGREPCPGWRDGSSRSTR
jgi:glycine/D-amino acid oxidase-like deaminating enzyme